MKISDKEIMDLEKARDTLTIFGSAHFGNKSIDTRVRNDLLDAKQLLNNAIVYLVYSRRDKEADSER